MTIYQTLLAKGYFPKELPPAFSTESLAKYAANSHGKSTLNSYSPTDNYTECVKYRLARPGLYARELRIAHPASFSKLAELTAKSFTRLLKAANSPFSRSRPVYATGRERAILPMLRPLNLARERAALSLLIRRAALIQEGQWPAFNVLTSFVASACREIS
jgi:hypothetical protein